MINLNFQYKRLFTIKINHNYYPTGTTDDFYIVPTRRTAQLIEKMSMLLRYRDGEIHVLFDNSSLDLLYHRLSNSNDADSRFSFMVFTKNQYFVNITDIPVDLNGKVFYCSNRNLGDKKAGFLHNREYVDADDLYDVLPQEINHNKEVNVEYKIVYENEFANNEFSLNQANNGFQVDTSKLLEGCYKIFGNDRELSKFINLEPKTKGSPIGFIDILLNKKIKQEILNDIVDKDVKTYNYTINFNSRSIFWKYIIFPTYLKRVKELSVNCQKGKDKLEFKKIGEEEIGDKKAISFISKDPVKFKKFYEYEIQLKKLEGGEGGKTIIKKMSYAPFDLLKPVNETHYMSEIYIYI